MKHTKRRKRHTLRRRNTRRKRVLRGGRKCELNENEKRRINWPADDGCEPGSRTNQPLIIPTGTRFNRFGPPYGTFVAEIPLTGKPPTYNERALPYFGLQNNNGISCNKSYIENPPEYHLYEVDRPIKKNEVKVEKCTAAAFAGHKGKAIQLKFNRPVEKLVEQGYLKEIKKSDEPIILPKFI